MSYETGEILGMTVAPYFRMGQGTGDPSTTDIPSGYAMVWWNTQTGDIKLWANKNGVLVSIALA